MANTVKIKRGLATNLPTTLQTGEQAFTTDTGKLYIGDGSKNVLINPDKASGAATADKLTTARTIAISGAVTGTATSFDGSANITIPTTSLDATKLSGTAAINTTGSAAKLTTARAITLTGDVTGTANFDGSAAASITATLASSGVTAGTYPKVTVDAKGRVTAGASLAAADIPNLTLSKITDAGTAASKNVGTGSGQIPILDTNGKLVDSVIPGVAILDVVTAATEAAMLAQTGLAPGDMCIRSDTGDLYVLKQTPASTLANWIPIYTKNSVLSVNGQTGAVTITTITGNAGSATKLQTARTLAISGGATGTATSFDGSANITIPVTALDVSKATAGTLPVGRGGTGAATLTGLVKANGTSAFTAAVVDTDYLNLSSIIDCGAF